MPKVEAKLTEIPGSPSSDSSLEEGEGEEEEELANLQLTISPPMKVKRRRMS